MVAFYPNQIFLSQKFIGWDTESDRKKKFWRYGHFKNTSTKIAQEWHKQQFWQLKLSTSCAMFVVLILDLNRCKDEIFLISFGSLDHRYIWYDRTVNHQADSVEIRHVILLFLNYILGTTNMSFNYMGNRPVWYFPGAFCQKCIFWTFWWFLG